MFNIGDKVIITSYRSKTNNPSTIIIKNNYAGKIGYIHKVKQEGVYIIIFNEKEVFDRSTYSDVIGGIRYKSMGKLWYEEEFTHYIDTPRNKIKYELLEKVVDYS